MSPPRWPSSGGASGSCRRTIRGGSRDCRATGSCSPRTGDRQRPGPSSPEPESERDEAHREADAAIAVFERRGDLLGLALAWELHAIAYWRDGKVSLEEPARERAIEFARAAGDRNEEVEALTSVGRALVLGPTPVPEGIARTEELLAAAGGDRRIESAMAHALAHLYAQAGRFEEGRAMAARATSILEENGLAIDAASMTEVHADVEHWAGESAAEERWYRAGMERIRGLGANASMHAAFLANSLCESGGYDEAAALAEPALAAGGWIAAGARRALGLAVAHRGDPADGEALVRESLVAFEATDFLNLRAGAWLGRAEVLRLTGRDVEAREAVASAAELYRLKANAVGLARTESLLRGG